MIRTQKRMTLCMTLLVFNLLFIWGNSLLPGEISGAISGWVKNLLSYLVPGEGDPQTGHGLLRKIAHFMEFSCLGILLCWLHAMLGKKPWRSLIYSIVVACIDEGIQCFVPDRGPGIRDVMIDTSGAVLGMLLLLAGHAVYKKRKQKSLYLKENAK